MALELCDEAKTGRVTSPAPWPRKQKAGRLHLGVPPCLLRGIGGPGWNPSPAVVSFMTVRLLANF